MKYITNTIASLLLTSSIIACGGGSSSEPEGSITPPPQPAPTFSFKVLQENDCNQLSSISNIEFLVYDESPNINPNTNYSTYQSDSNGIVALDIDSSAKISFTLNLTDALGELVSYSFTELAVGNYSMTALFGESAYTNENCSCQTVNRLMAEVSGEHYISEVRNASLHGGNNLKIGSFFTSGSEITFDDNQYCGSDFNGSPLIATADLYGYNDRIIYGINQSPSLTAISSEILSLDNIAYDQPKPNLGFEYYLAHSLIFNNQTYLRTYSYSENPNYFAFNELTPDAHYFQISDRNFATSYEGITDSSDVWVFGEKYRRQATTSSDPSQLASVATGSEINVTFDTENKQALWQTDSTSQFNMTYLSRTYFSQAGQYIKHYIYAPYTGSVQIPPNTNAIESDILNSELKKNYLSLISMTGKSDFTDAVKARRFNDENDIYRIGIADSAIYSYYYDTNVGNSSKQMKTNNDDILNKQIARELVTQDINF